MPDGVPPDSSIAGQPGDGRPGAAAGASLWRNGAFVRVFSASAISYFGSFITRVALPLAAIYVLGANALGMSAIRSFELVGSLVVGLFAGAWVDRLRRRPIMISADLGRALLLASIPLAAVAGILSLPQLVVVAFLAAILSSFFDTASFAYLPSVVGRARLITANSALSASASAAEVTGFGLSGFLVQLLTAPIAIAIDAASFVISAALLVTIRQPEPPRPSVAEREPVLREIQVGVREVARSPTLRAIALAHAGNHLLWGVFGTTYLLFATQVVGLGAAAIGVVTAVGGAGSLVGAAAAGRLAGRLGVGGAMILGLVGFTLGNALITLAPSGAVLIGGAMLVAQQLFGDASATVHDVLETSVKQAIVDERVLGRVNATIDFVTTITALVGSLGGGILAVAFGLREAMVFGLLGGATAVAFLWFSPVRGLWTIPAGGVGGPGGAIGTAPITPEDLPLTE
ncbi:MAG TPA: MFS transporter [Candidatus Limnocylindrales bacterium]|nr:MFS transporter [Candidatus Limnocylindrales bacterium]